MARAINYTNCSYDPAEGCLTLAWAAGTPPDGLLGSITRNGRQPERLRDAARTDLETSQRIGRTSRLAGTSPVLAVFV